MNLWIGNLPPETSDDDLSAFLQKYGLPPCASVLRAPGDGSRPGALVSFSGVERERLYEAAFRLNGLYWNSRSLTVQVMLH